MGKRIEKKCFKCGISIEVIPSKVREHNYCSDCHKKKGELPTGKAAFNKIFASYKKNAQIRGLCFNLSKEEAYSIMKENCFYCGIAPLRKFSIKRNDGRINNGSFIYNGIDRVDTLEGYIKTNVVSCCTKCNHAKWDLPKEDFLIHIKRIYNFNYGDTNGDA